MAKIDVGGIINQFATVGANALNKLIGSGGNPLNTYERNSSQIKVGNVGGIFGINLNLTTILLIVAGVVGFVLVIKKVK